MAMMRTKNFKWLGILSIAALMLAGPVRAMVVGHGRTLILPPKAANAKVVHLGKAIDPQTGKMVEGLAVFHHRDGHGGGGNPGGGGGEPTTSSCYGFLAKDAKWKTVEDWVVNTENSDGLGETFVFDTLADGVDQWEAAAEANIVGGGAITADVLTADTVTPDGVNEVYFADISEPGAVGVTIVWGIFGGRPSNRELVEWDQVYDDVDFEWTEDAVVETNKMDYANTAVHELGHTMGMDDLYDGSCAEETMYGYVTEGEVKNRDLNVGDITGISKLY